MMKNLIAFAFSAFLLSCAGAPKTEEKSFIDENIDFARAQIGNEIGVIEASGKCLNPVTLKTDSSVYYCGYADWRSGFFPGSVWYLYELTGDSTLLPLAAKYTDAIEEAKQVLSEEGGRIALTKTNTILDENNPGVTYVSQYQGSGYEHAAEDLFRILNDVAAEKVQEDCQTELTEELQKTANDIHYGNAHAGIHVTIHRLTSVSDYLKNEYQTVAPPLLRASKKLQSTILPLLKEEQQGGKQKNLLFGKRLDSHALYKTDGTIFTRTRLPGEEKRLAVALLIDESGSMGWGDRMTHARKTAIVLYDFCKSLGIPITIYGHSTDAGGVALYSYAEFDSVDNEDCYRLMDMCDRNGNRDGAALRFVAEHLCTRPELQKLLILISDGQPADYGYSGTEAEADLRGIKKEYEKRDVILFAAAIGDDKENIRRIYKDGFLDITKLEELPKNMAQLVKQHLK